MSDFSSSIRCRHTASYFVKNSKNCRGLSVRNTYFGSQERASPGSAQAEVSGQEDAADRPQHTGSENADYIAAARQTACSGDCDRRFRSKVITDSGDRDRAVTRPI